MKITINPSIYSFIKDFKILAYHITYESAKDALISKHLLNESSPYDISEVTNIPYIKEVRDLYKKMGLDPSHTRSSQEALIRRVINHKLTSISPMVDLGNILSIEAMRSVCVADMDQIDSIYITIGKKNERLDPINRASLNLENLIIYRDKKGVFGSTTSDAKRTMVTSTTKNYLLMIVLFTKERVEKQLLAELCHKYLSNYQINKIEVKNNDE